LGENDITDFALSRPNDMNDIIVQSGDNDITDFAICQVFRVMGKPDWGRWCESTCSPSSRE